MRKSLFLALSVVVLSGCAQESHDSYSDENAASGRTTNKEWKEFVAPLSVKTQTPWERRMKQAENEQRKQNGS
ncbi:hypothetical protein BTJ39_09105 [Izhakiella australiensis]|uniref:Type IV secretion system putative lipoprotein virB7 n=1 Tax=Izhakiella australiensis TaxID=1926881 RepID=A0A1S8YN19_9GAMM|nr:membrane lipoprotein lipid attachment site-containing protein [Izhakiella australiensis]OON40549.1 hypothetical protein BTJ39_09105 [Izhakiella australiensis]